MSVTRKPQIPTTTALSMDLQKVIGPIKESLEIITGAKGAQVNQLATNASLTDCINKINELIARLNARGS